MNLLREFLVGFITIIAALLFLNPFGILMPNTLAMMIIGIFIIAFILFSIFIWREGSKDEREAAHKMFAGRAAFLAGSGVMVLGIIIQSFEHKVDPWLVLGLTIMIVAKTAVLIYSKKNL